MTTKNTYFATAFVSAVALSFVGGACAAEEKKEAMPTEQAAPAGEAEKKEEAAPAGEMEKKAEHGEHEAAPAEKK